MKTRLHKYLANYLQSIGELGYTVPEIKRNIESCGVILNGTLTKRQLEWAFDGSSIELLNWPKRVMGDTSLIQIIHEDEFCIVINKPFGLVVEPGAGHVLDNVTTWLMDNYPNQNFEKIYKASDLTDLYKKYGIETRDMKSSDDNSSTRSFALPKTGMVHRIDKNTQGILLIAKSLEYYVFFQKQFREHTILKKYLAIAQGVVDHKYDVHNYQSRDYSNPIRNRLFWTHKDAMNYSVDSRDAHSYITPVLSCAELNQTLVEVQIMTGRMHQIRLQCEALGFPLVGDNVYKSNSTILYDFDLNPKNSRTLTNPKIQGLTKESFFDLKQNYFGDHKYCLISNQMSFMLPNAKKLELKIN